MNVVPHCLPPILRPSLNLIAKHTLYDQHLENYSSSTCNKPSSFINHVVSTLATFSSIPFSGDKG